jgi:hypothetical protein
VDDTNPGFNLKRKKKEQTHNLLFCICEFTGKCKGVIAIPPVLHSTFGAIGQQPSEKIYHRIQFKMERRHSNNNNER